MALAPKGSKSWPKEQMKRRTKVEPGYGWSEQNTAEVQSGVDKMLRRPAGKKALNKAVRAGVAVTKNSDSLYSYKNTDGDVDAAAGSFRGSYVPNRASGRGINLSGLYQGKQFMHLGMFKQNSPSQVDSDPESALDVMKSPGKNYSLTPGMAKMQDKIEKKVNKRISKAKKSDALGASRNKK